MGKWTDTGAGGLVVGTLPAVVTPASTDEFIVEQGGVNKKETRAQLHTLETGEQFGIANGSKTELGLQFTFDTDTGMFLQETNTQSFVCGGVECLRVGTVAGGANHMSVTSGAAGDGPTLAAAGLDTNVDLLLSPKGTGRIVANGFTKLGDVAPAIKLKKLTGTTGINEGDATRIAHGLIASKIIGLSVLVAANNGNPIPPGLVFTPEYEYDAYIDPTDVIIRLSNLNSGNMTGNAIVALLTHEE